MHVHFADPASPELFVANGVTGVRVMWGNPPFAPGMERFHFDMRDSFDKQEQIGPRMVIASNIMDGPKPVWPNSLALSTPDEGRKAVDDAKASGVDFIKVYSLLPREVFFAIGQESRRVGLPFVGHVPESVSVAEASDAGQKSIEHLTGMLVACSSREAELRKKQKDYAAKGEHTAAEWATFRRAQLAEAIATYDAKHAGALFAKLVANGTWQTPTLTVLKAMATLDDPAHASDPRLEYVSTFMRRRWDPTTDFRTKSRTAADYAAARDQLQAQIAIVGAMNQAGVPLLAGTDELNPYCFAGFGLHDELALLVSAGLSPAQALRAATSSPARFFGWEAKMGTVAEGEAADLVVLDADPLADIGNTKKISAVISRGTFYDRAALDKMLADVKHTAAHPQWGGTP
jgi:imidazolonepropionase-like amidohydrolase